MNDLADDGFHEIQLSGKQLVFLFMATTVTGNGRTIEAIPLDKVREVLRNYGIPQE